MVEERKVLVAEDEVDLLNGLRKSLSKEGYSVDTAEDGLQAVNRIKHDDYDVVIADLKMPRVDGMEVLRRTRQLRPRTVCIIITGYGTVESAVEAMKLGAFDYIAKPFTLAHLKHVLENALEIAKEFTPPSVVPPSAPKREKEEEKAGIAQKPRVGKYFPPHFWEGCFNYTCGKDTCLWTAQCYAAQSRHQRETERFIRSVNQLLLKGRALSAIQQAQLDHAVKHHGARLDAKKGIYFISKAALKSCGASAAAYYR